MHGVGTKIVKVFWGKSRGKVGNIVQMFGESCMVMAKILFKISCLGGRYGKRLEKCIVVWKVCVH